MDLTKGQSVSELPKKLFKLRLIKYCAVASEYLNGNFTIVENIYLPSLARNVNGNTNSVGTIAVQPEEDVGSF
jgi:hypothetical protein